MASTFWRRAVPAMLVIATCAASVAACSSNTSRATAVADPDRARTLAGHAQLGAKDLGSGWTVSSAASPTAGADLRACPLGDLTSKALASSKGSSFNKGTDVSHLAQVVQMTSVVKEADVEQFRAEFDPAGLQSCAKKGLTATAASSDARFDPARVRATTESVKGADQATILTIPFTTVLHSSTRSSDGTSSGDSDLNGTVRVLFIRVGQAISALGVLDIGHVARDDELVTWAGIVTTRLRQAA